MGHLDPEARDLVLEILRVGLLRIRSSGWAGDAKTCADEGDHLHNLPEVLASGDPGMMRYYLYTERLAFEAQARDLESFRPLWARLEELYPGLE